MRPFSTRMARGCGAGNFIQHATFSTSKSTPVPNALGIKSPVSITNARQFRAPRRAEGKRTVMTVSGKMRYQGTSEQGVALWA